LSCVIALRNSEGNICMGADIYASSSEEIRRRQDKKVFQNMGLRIGFSGSIRVGQCLHPDLWTPKEGSTNIIQIANSIREHLAEMGTLMSESGTDAMDANIIICMNGGIYEILEDFQVQVPAESFTAIGAGKSYALGSLFTTSGSGQTLKERVEKALEAAAYFTPGIRPPFSIIEF